MTTFVPEKCLQIAMKITVEEDAIQYLKEYIKYIQDNNPTVDAEMVAKSNLGYYAGYYSNEVRERVEKLFKCKHPFFGSIKDGAPSSSDAFNMGMKIGNNVIRKEKIKKINNEN